MEPIHIVIPIDPKPQARPRTATINGHAMAYKGKKQRSREDVLRFFLFQHPNCPKEPLEGALKLGLRIVLGVPKSWPQKKRVEALCGELRPTSKPDLDNFIKFFKDVGNELLWKDDSCVVEYLPGTGKYYGEQPRWEITIEAA
jgi:Holliday junction resolvase RusA-like endonuclease